jgi:hypothetical protein
MAVSDSFAFTASRKPGTNGGLNENAVDPLTNQPLLTDTRGAGFPRIVDGTVDIGAFEVQQAAVAPTNKEQCENGGWMTFTMPRTFKNQGDCIRFVNTGK